MIGRIYREIESIVCANQMILNYPKVKAQKNKVNLHYYHAELIDGSGQTDANLGDYLSEVIVRWLCGQNAIDYEQLIDTKRHLYAIGSILQMGYQNATVWGSGFAFELSKLRGLPHRKRKLDIRCVRGPLTHKVLTELGFDCPKVYGDPAVLMPMLYQPRSVSHTDYVIIPHYSVEQQTRNRYGDEHIISMNTKDYSTVIDRICASNRVISSSLHGIILAEAYGIPAVFYQDRPPKFNFKYDDWYQSTGRFDVSPCGSIEDCLEKTFEKPNEKSLSEMRKRLIDTFPQDLWRKTTPDTAEK